MRDTIPHESEPSRRVLSERCADVSNDGAVAVSAVGLADGRKPIETRQWLSYRGGVDDVNLTIEEARAILRAGRLEFGNPRHVCAVKIVANFGMGWSNQMTLPEKNGKRYWVTPEEMLARGQAEFAFDFGSK